MRKSSNFKYFVSEGCKSYTQNAIMSISSTIIVVASLVVFGIYLLFSMNINYIAEQIKEDCEIRVWIDESIEPGSTQMQDIENQIKSIYNVKEIAFHSNEQAFTEWKEELGEDAVFFEGLDDDNPLRDSYEISLIDLELAENTSKKIEKIKGVASVNDNQTSVNKLINITKIIKNISFWFMMFLCALAIFIISNTIKITLFARRRNINIMKYIGATNSFISWPYIVEGIVIGIVGALISIMFVVLGYTYFVSMDFTLLEAMNIQFCAVGDVILALCIWFLSIGILLGAVGSAVSIRRHLNV